DKIFNRINIEIKKSHYVSKRYKSKFTFAILYYEGVLSLNELGSFVRISDHLIEIDENHYFINFTFTRPCDSVKAAQNLIFYLDRHFNNTTSCIAINTFDILSTPKKVCDVLYNILEETKKASYSRVEDESILMRVH
ncbi:MAG: hypothetical protein J7J96_01495, partial [Sulfurimonas sp.]|nr:hypothetical protein [Sulfurimonas sp.]